MSTLLASGERLSLRRAWKLGEDVAAIQEGREYLFNICDGWFVGGFTEGRFWNSCGGSNTMWSQYALYEMVRKRLLLEAYELEDSP